MSIFSNKIIDAVEKTFKIQIIKEYNLGQFISGYTRNKIRKADLFIKTDQIYGLTKNTIIEIQGSQHYDKNSARVLFRNHPKWKDKFYDLVLRDRWEEKILQQKDILLIMDPGQGSKVIKLEDFYKTWTGNIMIFNYNKKLPIITSKNFIEFS